MSFLLVKSIDDKVTMEKYFYSYHSLFFLCLMKLILDVINYTLCVHSCFTFYKSDHIELSRKCNPSIIISDELVIETNATKYLDLLVDQCFT